MLATETPSLAKSLSGCLVPSVPARVNLRAVRLVTFATMSKPVTETKKREPRGIMKPRPVSPEMQALVGESEIPRTQALKKIWAYIKQHNLQVYILMLLDSSPFAYCFTGRFRGLSDDFILFISDWYCFILIGI